MSTVRFCIEEDNPYSLERLEKVLGRDFWYRDKELRRVLKGFISNANRNTLIDLLRKTPHAPVYEKEKFRKFQPNVLLITYEPALNEDVIEKLYLAPAQQVITGIRRYSRCIYEERLVLEEIIEKFNRSMFSWLTLTPLREINHKINGDKGLNVNFTTNPNNLIYHFKKVSYWIPNIENNTEQINIQDWTNMSKKDIPKIIINRIYQNKQRKEWLGFLLDYVYGKKELRVIHWDLLPYAQKERQDDNEINDEIKALIEEETNNTLSFQIFKDINRKIKSEVSHEQSQWYVKLLHNFLEVFKEVNMEEEKFFILVAGNRIIKKDENDDIEKDRIGILGHLFAGLCEAKKEDIGKLREAIVIFRDRWCSCSNPRYYPVNLYFVKFDKFLDNNGNFSWTEFENVLENINQKFDRSTYYGGKNKIPCY